MSFVNTGVPSFGRLILSALPHIILDVKADAAHKIRIWYLSTNTGTAGDGLSEVATFTSKTEIPLLPTEHHNLVVELTTAMIAEDFGSIANRDGSPKYPGMLQTAQLFRVRYERNLAKAKESASKRLMGRGPVAFRLAGAERYARRYGSRGHR